MQATSTEVTSNEFRELSSDEVDFGSGGVTATHILQGAGAGAVTGAAIGGSIGGGVGSGVGAVVGAVIGAVASLFT